jgi:predicted nucleotidyltransferase
MMDASEIIDKITGIFKQNGVDRVILFGSHATGNPSSESDIDLIVVVPGNSIPATHREKMELYLHYNKLIKELRKIIPIDLLVFTRAAYLKFIELDSLFSREITSNGIVLYEAGNQRVA